MSTGDVKLSLDSQVLRDTVSARALKGSSMAESQSLAQLLLQKAGAHVSKY